MYYIKKIFLTGNGVETSGVDLTPGLNIIYGPSETGKSYITKCIKFMYVKKDSEIDDTFGFNTIHMILDVDGKPLTLVRRLDEEKINVSGNIDGIENGDYTLSSGKKRIGDLWLSLMGIDEPTQIIKKNDFTSERLNFSSLWHMFLVDEDTISKTESILMPSQYSKWPKTKAAILFLMLGDNFLKDQNPKEKAKAKERRKAVETFINTRISTLVTRKQTLKDGYKGLTMDELQKKIGDVLKEIDSAEKQMNAAIIKSRELANEIIDIDEQLAESKALKNRYKALRSQYRSDIRRLTFIAEGDIEGEKIKKPVNCPYCGNSVDEAKRKSYVEPAKAEVEKLVPKISDLQDAQDEIDSAIKSLEKHREEAVAEKDTLDQKIKSQMRPRISELQDHLLEYKLAVEYSKEEQVLSDMEQEMKKELKKYEAEDGLELKFDVDAHYTDEIMERWDKIIDNLFRECHYDKFDISVFSKSAFDVSVNGHPKKTFGEGYRAFVNVIMILSLQNYLEQYGKYKSDIIVLDSPILTLKERVSVKASDGMQASLFKYLVSHQSGHQTIVIENELPKIDYTGVNMIHFTQEEDGSRYGLLKGVK